jgi:hypothetical protein
MPRDRIQPRTWFVEFSLKADRKPSDDETKDCIINILDISNGGSRRIRGLQHVVCAHTSMDITLPLDAMTPDPASSPAYFVDVIGFVHSNESILDTTMHSWIQESHVVRQRWTPVYIQPGTGGNWMQQDLIRNLFDDCNSGRRVRVDWLWTGDASGSIRVKRRGQPPHSGAEASKPLNADHLLVCSPPPSQ